MFSEQELRVDLQRNIKAELQLRTELLPDEVARWLTLSNTNTGGMGIHKSQFQAVAAELDEILKTQTAALQQFDSDLPKEEFVQKLKAVGKLLTVTHSIASVFRYMLDQRENPETLYGDFLDASDRIAADSYSSFMDKAHNFQLLLNNVKRPPPLTFFHARRSPAAYTSASKFSLFDTLVDIRAVNPERPLPISVISLPFDSAVALWTLCSSYHEVGHILDQDIGLSVLGSGLDAALNKKLPDRGPIWNSWRRELVADVIGVLLGGTAFAYSLVSMLIGPVSDVAKADSGDRHPTPYVRVHLLIALLRKVNLAEFSGAADDIEAIWNAYYPEATISALYEAADYLPDCPTVANVLLDTELKALENNELSLFASELDLDEDHTRAAELATYLYTGDDEARPPAASFPIRLVPAATQLAVNMVSHQHKQTQRDIHHRAIDFVCGPQGIPRPKELGDATLPPAREAELRALVRDFNFAALADELLQ